MLPSANFDSDIQAPTLHILAFPCSRRAVGVVMVQPTASTCQPFLQCSPQFQSHPLNTEIVFVFFY